MMAVKVRRRYRGIKMLAQYVTEAEAYENLANAIITEAVHCYRNAYLRYLRKPNNSACRANLDELRVFFNSHWYRALTTLDADYILSKIEKECNELHAMRINILNKR